MAEAQCETGVSAAGVGEIAIEVDAWLRCGVETASTERVWGNGRAARRLGPP